VSPPVLDAGTPAFDAPSPVDGGADDVWRSDAHDVGPNDAEDAHVETSDAPSEDVLIGDAPADAE
jgi:hypothetical protein